MGESYKSVFEELSSKLSKIFLKNEFDRRKHLRSKNVIKESEIYFDDSQNGVTEKIILPLEKDSKYDQIVALQILASMPKFILEYYTDQINKKLQFTLVHKLNSLNNSISYSGNIVSIIPSIGERIFNEISGGPQHVMLDSENLPDFSMLFVETDIIENNYFENNDMQILKYFSTKTQSTPQLIDFSANLEYKQLRFKEANERNLKDQLPPMSINISLRDKFFKSLNIKQGSILINLHFRKKL